MIKIKSIEYTKVVYDESLSHNIFSIANITFTNREPIHGALLYWQRNTDKAEYTKQGDYKFFYDMANIQYFASVKFPKYVNLSKEEKQELAYILLEERGSVGSYSFSTNVHSNSYSLFKQKFAALQFPENFNPAFCPLYVKDTLTQMELNLIQHNYPTYDETFIRAYAEWRYDSKFIHIEQLQPYLDLLDLNFLVVTNRSISDLFLIEHLNNLNVELLAENIPVVAKLSGAFQKYICEQIDEEHAESIREFIQFDLTFDDSAGSLENDTEEALEYFAYDRGMYKWPGSEHLVKGIPSLRSMQYDEQGYKKRTNREMDELTKLFNEDQWLLFSACAEPHWLHRYRNFVHWPTVCAFNRHLSEAFIIAIQKHIDFKSLGQNAHLRLSEAFLTKYMAKFNHQKPQPLIIRNLTETLYLEHQTTLNVSYDALMEYSHLIEEPRLQALINLFH